MRHEQETQALLAPKSLPNTMENALETVGYGSYQYQLMLLCSVSWATEAMEALLLSFLLPELGSVWQLTPNQQGLLASSVFVGIVFGSVFWGSVSDHYGRRIGYLGCSGFGAVFGALSALANSYTQLVLLRFLVGFGLGGSCVAYSLLSEFIPGSHRGTALLYNQFFWTLGAILEALIAWGTLESLGWRVFLLISGIPQFLLLLLYPILPESPRYMLTHDRAPEAMQLIRDIGHKNGRPLSESYRIPTPVVEKVSIWDIFKGSRLFLTVLVWMLWVAVSLLYYGVVFYTPRAFSLSNSYFETLVTTLAEIPGLPISLYTIDWMGRRNTMMLFFSGLLTFSLAFQAVYYIDSLQYWTLLVLLFGQRLCASSAFAILYIYTSEVYPTVIRTTALGLATAVSRIGSISASFIATRSSTTEFTWFISGFAMLSCIATYSLEHDTTGIALPDVFNTNVRNKPSP